MTPTAGSGKGRPGAALGYEDFVSCLDRGEVAPIYLLTGEENFLIQAALDRLGRVAIEPAARDFNYSVLDGDSATADVILTAAESLPAFAPRRLVVLRSAEQLPAAEANRLIAYLKNPSPTTSLVCVASRFDARRSFFQTLRAQATVVECRPLTEAQVSAWLPAQARVHGRTLTPDAALFLKERLGRDLYSLHNELAKAALLTGESEKGRIDLKIIQQVCGAAGTATVYDLLDGLAARRIESALRSLSRLIEEGEPPLKILATIRYRYRLVWKVKRAMQAGHPDAALRRMFGLGQWAAAPVLAAAKGHSETDLRWSLIRFAETDAGLKGGIHPPNRVMELLVMDLCTGRQKGLRRFLGRQPLLYL